MTVQWRSLKKAGRIEAIRSVYRTGMTTSEIASALGIGKSAVCGFYFRYREMLADCPLVIPSGGRPAKPKTEKRTVREKYLVWTAEKRADVAALLGDGETAEAIGKRFGVTRHTIVGLVHRNAELNAIGFNSRQKNRLGNPEKAQRQRQARRRHKAKVMEAAPRPVRAPFKPVVVSNNVHLMVQDFIAKNGVRRFQEGETSDYFHLTYWLRERGYELAKVSNSYRLSNGRGRPRTVGWSDVIALVDKLRRAEGLQPFMAA